MKVCKGTVLFLFMSVLMWSCSGDDNGNPADKQDPTPEEDQSLAGEWIMNRLNFEGSTAQGDNEVGFKGDDKKLNPEDTFFLNKDGTYQAGTEPLALNVTVTMNGTTLSGEDLAPLGVDTDRISPFLTKGTWEATEDNTAITFTEEGSEDTTTFKVEEFDEDNLKITTKDGYPLVKTAGIIPGSLVDALGHIDIEVTMGFERK